MAGHTSFDLHGTDCALIVRSDGQTEIAVPDMKDRERVPEHVLALSALLIRWRDPSFQRELAEEFMALPTN